MGMAGCWPHFAFGGGFEKMTRGFVLPIALWLAVSGAASAQEVSKVVNGETIEVEGVGKIGLVGIEASDPAMRFGPSGPSRPPRSGPNQPPPPLITGSIGVKPDSASGDALKRLVLGKRVRLEYDEAANKEGGTPSRPFSSLDRFKELEAEARADLRGLWSDVEKR